MVEFILWYVLGRIFFCNLRFICLTPWRGSLYGGLFKVFLLWHVDTLFRLYSHFTFRVFFVFALYKSNPFHIISLRFFWLFFLFHATPKPQKQSSTAGKKHIFASGCLSLKMKKNW